MTAISTYQFSIAWNLVEWTDLVACTITACLSGLAGAVAMLAFRQNITKTKSVVIVASIQVLRQYYCVED